MWRAEKLDMVWNFALRTTPKRERQQEPSSHESFEDEIDPWIKAHKQTITHTLNLRRWVVHHQRSLSCSRWGTSQKSTSGQTAENCWVLEARCYIGTATDIKGSRNVKEKQGGVRARGPGYLLGDKFPLYDREATPMKLQYGFLTRLRQWQHQLTCPLGGGISQSPTPGW